MNKQQDNTPMLKTAEFWLGFLGTLYIIYAANSLLG